MIEKIADKINNSIVYMKIKKLGIIFTKHKTIFITILKVGYI